MKKGSKTIQIGLRLEKELLNKIEKLAESEGIDKMAWIKRALGVFVGDEEDDMTGEAIKDYIHLIIDEDELKRYTGFKEIPKDIQEARKEILKQITKSKEV
ncbi:hypothetical protein HYX08_01205 [Candidatus Woesearchaeota archaeon]|nr:hypothetical protein [Candidatus Woesearchaeota archaeon]